MALQTAGATSAVAGSPIPRGLRAVEDEHIDARSLVHAQQPVGVEVGLLHAAALNIDLAHSVEVRPKMMEPSTCA